MKLFNLFNLTSLTFLAALALGGIACENKDKKRPTLPATTPPPAPTPHSPSPTSPSPTPGTEEPGEGTSPSPGSTQTSNTGKTFEESLGTFIDYCSFLSNPNLDDQYLVHKQALDIVKNKLSIQATDCIGINTAMESQGTSINLNNTGTGNRSIADATILKFFKTAEVIQVSGHRLKTLEPLADMPLLLEINVTNNSGLTVKNEHLPESLTKIIMLNTANAGSFVPREGLISYTGTPPATVE